MDNAEIEARRLESVAVLKARDKAAWADRYQAMCDRLYWSEGRCCAGCDHWRSDGGFTGVCLASGIVPGIDVIKSIGVEFSSYIPPPGFPYSDANDYCGLFRDDFDWSSLDDSYLRSIGAMKNDKILPQPEHQSGRPRDD